MIDDKTIIQLMESPNYDDNRLALHLIATKYSKEQLLQFRDEDHIITKFSTTKDDTSNGVYVEDEDYILYHGYPDYLRMEIKGERKYDSVKRYTKEGKEFVTIKRKNE